MPRPRAECQLQTGALSHPATNRAACPPGLSTPFTLGLTELASQDGLMPGTGRGTQAAW